MSQVTKGKENKYTQNTGGGTYKSTKNFSGGNVTLQGKVFKISAQDVVHCTDTMKAIDNYVGQEYTHGRDTILEVMRVIPI